MRRRILERDAALKPLSRDHGVLLVLAQELLAVAGAGPKQCAQLREKLHASLGPLVQHYLSDEDAALSRLGIDDVLWKKISRDHTRIRQLLDLLPAIYDHAGLREHFEKLGRLIDAHIRWDEHVLFPYLQETSDSSSFSTVYEYTAGLESKRDRPTQKLHRSINLKAPTGRQSATPTVPAGGERMFLCQSCDHVFRSTEDHPSCDRCHARFQDNLVTIYLEDDHDKEQMYTSADWHAGD